MNQYSRYLFYLVLFFVFLSCKAFAAQVLDQEQTVYDGGLSARNLPGESVGQSFTAEITGTLTEIDMGFFNNISGSGQLEILTGTGTGGAVLQTETVSVSSTSSALNWNEWQVDAPVVSGHHYTFIFTPGETMPDPYGVCIGDLSDYTGGSELDIYPTYVDSGSFQSVFRTYVSPGSVSSGPALNFQVGTGGQVDQWDGQFQGGLSARTLPGYTVGQAFTAELSGTLSEIDMAFFDTLAGSGTLGIYSGAGTGGTLLQSVPVSVNASGDARIEWNDWDVDVPVTSGSTYTFVFTPDAETLPDPYGVVEGDEDTYDGGTSYNGVFPDYDFQTAFRTYVMTQSGTASPLGTLDQHQSEYTGGLSARTLQGYEFGQSFKAGKTGVLTDIRAGFFGNISGDGRLQLFAGSGTTGNALLSEPVSVVSSGTGLCWNDWVVYAPVKAGSTYTYMFTPDSDNIPDPYGVATGVTASYAHGTGFTTDPSGIYHGEFQTVFETYVTSETMPAVPGLEQGTTYRGLISSTTTLINGAMTVAATGNSHFISGLYLGGKVYPFSGTFGGYASYTGTLANGTITVSMSLSGSTELTGTVTSAGQVFTYIAGQQGNKSAAPGAYRFTISPGAILSSGSAPEGTGYGDMTARQNGLVTIVGRLPDGSAFTASSVGTSGSTLPIYVHIGRGTNVGIEGTLVFSDIANTSDCAGTLYWAQPASRAWPSGFEMATQFIASSYDSTISGLGGDTVTFTADSSDFSSPLSEPVTLTAIPSGARGTENGVTLTINRITDSFSGTFISPVTQRKVPFSGALLPKSRTGAGLFGSGASAGTVTIQY